MFVGDTESDLRAYIIIGKNEKLGSLAKVFCAFNLVVFINFQEDAVIVACNVEWSSYMILMCAFGEQRASSVNKLMRLCVYVLDSVTCFQFPQDL